MVAEGFPSFKLPFLQKVFCKIFSIQSIMQKLQSVLHQYVYGNIRGPEQNIVEEGICELSTLYKCKTTKRTRYLWNARVDAQAVLLNTLSATSIYVSQYSLPTFPVFRMYKKPKIQDINNIPFVF